MRLLPLLLVAACGEPEPIPDGPCDYPEYAEPMAADAPLAPYSWPTSLHADGRSMPLDLQDVYCDTDEIIDWSMHDLLLFVSIPAW